MLLTFPRRTAQVSPIRPGELSIASIPLCLLLAAAQVKNGFVLRDRKWSRHSTRFRPMPLVRGGTLNTQSNLSAARFVVPRQNLRSLLALMAWFILRVREPSGGKPVPYPIELPERIAGPLHSFDIRPGQYFAPLHVGGKHLAE
jgi:hypothetical protein